MISLAYAALWLFVFSVPWEGIIRISGVSVVTRATGMLAFGLALFTVVISGRVRRWHVLQVAALLFVVWAGSTLLLIEIQEVPNKFYTYAQLLLVLWIIWQLATSRAAVHKLLLAYVLGAYVGALGTIFLYRRAAGELRRFAAGGADPNDLAMMLALAIPMAWYLGMTYRQPILRWICRGYLLVGVVAIGLTGSRGGMVTSLVALLVVPLTMTKLSPGRMVAAIVMLCGSGAVAVAYVPDTIVQRLATTSAEFEEASFGGRFKLWVAGLDAYTQYPIRGYGTSGFITAVKPRLGPRAQVAHNSYLSVLVEQGLVGFLLYMTMFIAVFFELIKLPQIERRFALVLLATLMVAMSPLTWEDRKPVWVILACLLGLAKAPGIGLHHLLRQRAPRPVASRAGSPVAARWRDQSGIGHRTPGQDATP